MGHKYFYSIFLSVVLIWLLTGSSISAQWSTDPTQNTPVNIQEYAQIRPLVCSDGSGGIYVVYEEKGQDLYMQRLDRFGYMKWNPAGVPICTVDKDQHAVKIINDGEGGAILLWKDYSEVTELNELGHYSNTLFVQKIDSNGTLLWGDEGVKLIPYRINTLPGWYDFLPTGYEDIITDGDGGVYICWNQSLDTLCIQQKTMSWAQHVTRDGIPIWEENGKPVKIIARSYIVADDEGGIFYIAGNDCVLRYDYWGELVWDDTLIVDVGYFGDLIQDNRGGIISCGYHHNGDAGDDVLYINRINAEGIVLWDSITFTISGNIIHEDLLKLCSDHNSGAMISWQLDEYGDYNTYVQHIDSNGVFVFPDQGIQSYMYLLDSYGNWFDFYSERNSNDTDYRIYFDKYDIDGQLQLSRILVKQRDVYYEGVSTWQFAPDNNGGVIMVWEETKHMTDYYDIMAQMVNAEGQLGEIILDVDITKSQPVIPVRYNLYSNYPNPFNPATTIQYDLPEQTLVTINVYNVLGKLVDTLVEQVEDPGNKSIIWDGTDSIGQPVGSGIYFYQMQAGDYGETCKMVLIK